MLQGMTESQFQRPEGKLIDEARKVKGISQRKAADLAGISDSRWRQIVNGYVTVGVGEKVPVVGPDETIAKMSAPLDITAEQLHAAGRGDAAALLLVQSGIKAQSDWQHVGTALERLRDVRMQIDSIIDELATTSEASKNADG